MANWWFLDKSNLQEQALLVPAEWICNGRLCSFNFQLQVTTKDIVQSNVSLFNGFELLKRLIRTSEGSANQNSGIRGTVDLKRFISAGTFESSFGPRVLGG